jgi:hypothetical protein
MSHRIETQYFARRAAQSRAAAGAAAEVCAKTAHASLAAAYQRRVDAARPAATPDKAESNDPAERPAIVDHGLFGRSIPMWVPAVPRAPGVSPPIPIRPATTRSSRAR